MTLTMCGAVEKKKKDLIHRAKLKKAYAKIKAREEQKGDAKSAPDAEPAPNAEAPNSEIEPEEAAGDREEPSHDTEEAPAEPPQNHAEPPKDTKPADTNDSPEPDPQMHPARRNNLHRRPGYFDRSLQESAKRQAQREAREAEFRRRREERERRVKERQRFRRVAAKAREVGPDGRRKLGRESEVLLEKVKRMVAKS